ncbi:serine hydroxymethyltransferase [Candidatus Uhrbacteria bacterium]|nr:serine hydroxymethyltransferase [Candidatus Uhrbacteria bacterium]
MYPSMDSELATLLDQELDRQRRVLAMIPSENHVSPAVLAATGSVCTNKYSEGYPGKRYYSGNEVIDAIEELARARARELFGVSHVNVQPYSGSPANLAVCLALLNPGDTIMGLDLRYGGHLTHGWKVSATGIYYRSVPYMTDADGWLDYDAIATQARTERPKLIFCGATAYPRIIDFAKLASIAREVDAFLVADIAHIAGLVAGGAHPSPVGHADVVTTTTHKTLRGPRGAMILCNGLPSDPLKAPPERTRDHLPSLIDRAVFPGLQGGPHDHQTAAIAAALHEAAQPEFRTYAQRIIENARALAETLTTAGGRLITGGTDNHLLLMDVTPFGTTGRIAAEALYRVGISVNFNAIPNDPRKPFDPSGIRLGTPALTTRGCTPQDMRTIGQCIAEVLRSPDDALLMHRTQITIRAIADAHPLYPTLSAVTA